MLILDSLSFVFLNYRYVAQHFRVKFIRLQPFKIFRTGFQTTKRKLILHLVVHDILIFILDDNASQVVELFVIIIIITMHISICICIVFRSSIANDSHIPYSSIQLALLLKIGYIIINGFDVSWRMLISRRGLAVSVPPFRVNFSK